MVGAGWGGGRTDLSDLAFWEDSWQSLARPSSLALPHKGGGNPLPHKPARGERTAFARAVQPETVWRGGRRRQRGVEEAVEAGAREAVL